MADPEVVRAEYRRKLMQHKKLDSRLRTLRDNVKGGRKEFDKAEDDLKAPQSVGQIIGEVLRQLHFERLIVKASNERDGDGGGGSRCARDLGSRRGVQQTWRHVVVQCAVRGWHGRRPLAARVPAR